MMSLTAMAPSAWRYYVEEVARGREDYYAHSAEHAGRFMGRGAASLGVSGMEADALGLERLFGHGADPRDGSPLGRGFSPEDSRAVAGFALTFSPPKTVSVLWALADLDIANEVAAAHGAAVSAALAFVDEHAAFSRRGHKGVLQVDTDGLIAAAFVHRTSRAADPQLHTHLLVANKVRAEDGKWLSLDARELFEIQKAAGMLYKAALRAELTSRLGVAWTAVDDNGVAEIAGVPGVLVEQWSARRHELKAGGDALIAKREAELGRTLSANERAECFQIAAYRTRTPKIDADTPTEEVRSHWLEEARTWGCSPEGWIGNVTGRTPRRANLRANKIVPAVIARLEEHSATWGRADVVEEVTRLVMGPDAETTRQLVESLTDRVLRHAEVVSLAGPLPAEAPASLRRTSPTRDAQLTYELQTSAKDMAELVMITDLLRNDLGKVCEYGSVQVPELVRLERYAHVQHLVSTVAGRLRGDQTHFSAFASCFPGGSVTGAPKIRAMEIIDELEPLTRGPYTGAIGYLGFNRESQLNIAIRTAVCQPGAIHFHVGAGIVAESVAEAEYDETMAKAGGYFAALRDRSYQQAPTLSKI